MKQVTFVTWLLTSMSEASYWWLLVELAAASSPVPARGFLSRCAGVVHYHKEILKEEIRCAQCLDLF